MLQADANSQRDVPEIVRNLFASLPEF